MALCHDTLSLVDCDITLEALVPRSWSSTELGGLPKTLAQMPYDRAENNLKTRRPPGTLGGTFDEMRQGTWRANARHRASRRKSAWNLLLPVTIIPIFLMLWVAAAILVQV